jgi:xanthine/CO dehydrogenase XdhC/CoxF family maturation factor
VTELQRLLDAHARVGAGVSVLATLVGVEGSAYRGLGARLLILPDGSLAGAISGGCLERDLVAHAERVRDSGAAVVVTYELRAGEDAPWGLNLGCHARLEVLLEAVNAGAAPDPLRLAREAEVRREEALLGIACADGPSRLGSWLVLTAGGRLAGPLSRELRPPHDAATLLRERRTARVAGVLYQFLAPPIRVVACGDGPDVEPVLRLAETVGWTAEQVRKHDALPGGLDERTAILVMTHTYTRDRELLAAALDSRARYVGVLGPRARTAQLLDDLRARGAGAPPERLAALHAPVGLDIGADGGPEVALAALAEIRAAFAGRGGGPLRERTGPIHER